MATDPAVQANSDFVSFILNDSLGLQMPILRRLILENLPAAIKLERQAVLIRI